MLFKTPDISADVEIQKHLTAVRVNEWLKEDLFHFKWWFLLAFFIVSVFIWWKLVDKSRLNEISLYAAFTVIITLGLDEFGDELGMWDYPVDILPIFPPLTAVDLVSLPMIYSLIYQRFKTWKSFLSATLIMAIIFCFILEPILKKGGFYQLLKWKYYYGFPIYIAISVILRLIVIKILAIAEVSNDNV